MKESQIGSLRVEISWGSVIVNVNGVFRLVKSINESPLIDENYYHMK